MADFEYVDVNGRQIRVRPRENAPGRESWMGICKFPGSYQSGNGRTVLK